MANKVIKITLEKGVLDQKIEVFADSRVVRVDLLNGSLYLWLLSNTNNQKFTRKYDVFTTNEDMPENIYRENGERLEYIGSAVNQTEEWHVYEKIKVI